MSAQHASGPDVVDVGCWVKITGLEPDEEDTLQVVDDVQADPTELKIAATSPLGRVLIGKQVGEKVPFKTPGGKVELTVVDVGPL